MIMCQEYHKISNLKDAKDQRRVMSRPKRTSGDQSFKFTFLQKNLVGLLG